MEFYIPETKETIAAKQRPIVIITSNAEKELPDAFLRRCIFHYIAFPSQDMMADIVHAHYNNIEDHLLEMAMKAFYQIRDLPTVAKKPSTSELLDWLQALRLGGVDPDKIENELPYAGILLKKNEDLTAVKTPKTASETDTAGKAPRTCPPSFIKRRPLCLLIYFTSCAHGG